MLLELLGIGLILPFLEILTSGEDNLGYSKYFEMINIKTISNEQLIFYSILLSVFAFGIVPWISGKVAPELTREVHAQGIDASALFYTESEAVGEAFNYFQNGRFNF